MHTPPHSTWLEGDIHLGPQGAARFIDRRIRRIAEGTVTCQIQVFAVGFIENVIQAGAELDVRVHLVSYIGGQHAKTRAVGKVFTDHVALIDGYAVLAADQTPKAGTAPVPTLVS
ncbi:hypothetical protein D3C76_1422820 [compost metagenome]